MIITTNTIAALRPLPPHHVTLFKPMRVLEKLEINLPKFSNRCKSHNIWVQEIEALYCSSHNSDPFRARPLEFEATEDLVPVFVIRNT